MDPDLDRALGMMAALNADTDHMTYVVIEGVPHSKARPRLKRGGRALYSPDRAAEEATGWHLRRSFREPIQGNVAIGCVFFRPNHQRIDVDNMLKHVLDAANAIVWEDDSQVTAVFGVVELDRTHPRTLIVVGEHDSTLQRYHGRVCPQCGTTFRLPWSGSKQRFCSATCRGESLRQQKRHPGMGRGRKGQPAARCRDCGRELRGRSYIRCRECWRTARTAGVS